MGGSAVEWTPPGWNRQPTGPPPPCRDLGPAFRRGGLSSPAARHSSAVSLKYWHTFPSVARNPSHSTRQDETPTRRRCGSAGLSSELRPALARHPSIGLFSPPLRRLQPLRWPLRPVSRAMPPAKARTSQDDPKSEAANPKDKAGHGSAAHQTNGKSRRVASAAGSQLREVTNASAAVAAPPTVHEATNPGVRPSSTPFGVQRSNRRLAAAPVDFVRPKRPPRLPSSLPPQHPRRLRQRLPPLGPVTTGQHRAPVPHDGETEGVEAAEQRTASQFGPQALQRAGNARERCHRRLPAQGQESRRHEARAATENRARWPREQQAITGTPRDLERPRTATGVGATGVGATGGRCISCRFCSEGITPRHIS